MNLVDKKLWDGSLLHISVFVIDYNITKKNYKKKKRNTKFILIQNETVIIHVLVANLQRRDWTIEDYFHTKHQNASSIGLSTAVISVQTSSDVKNSREGRYFSLLLIDN